MSVTDIIDVLGMTRNSAPAIAAIRIYHSHSRIEKDHICNTCQIVLPMLKVALSVGPLRTWDRCGFGHSDIRYVSSLTVLIANNEQTPFQARKLGLYGYLAHDQLTHDHPLVDVDNSYEIAGHWETMNGTLHSLTLTYAYMKHNAC